MQIEEWDYLNQEHTEETIAYLVAERGEHRLSDGRGMEVGDLKTNHAWQEVGFTTPFGDRPVVISRSQTFNGAQAIVTRHRKVNTKGFEVRLQDEMIQSYIEEQEGKPIVDDSRFQIDPS